MTTPEGKRRIETRYQSIFTWGEVAVSVGAAALFRLVPSKRAVGRGAILPRLSEPIKHPPLSIVLATSVEVDKPLELEGFLSWCDGQPADPAWHFILYGDAPPMTPRPEEIGLMAHAFSAMAGVTVTKHLPELLMQDGMPSVDPASAVRHSDTMGLLVATNIHALYCDETHQWLNWPPA